MKTKISVLSILILSAVTTGFAAADPFDVIFTADNTSEPAPHIGISLDPQPLDNLLTKHLQLKEDQGIRILNVVVGSPADLAGLERDDIVTAFQGKDVTDVEEFTSAVKKSGPDEEVTLGIIHLGHRKEIKMKLTTKTGEINWKYPPEPEAEISWQPGKIFHLKPGADDWIEMPGFPEGNVDVKKFMNEIYKFKHSENGSTYDITIHGDPEDPETKIELNVEKKDDTGIENKTEISATVGDIDNIPDEYKAAVKDALKSARKNSKNRQTFTLPAPKIPRHLFGKDDNLFNMDPHSIDMFKQGFDEGFREDINKQMKKLQEQMDRLNEEHKEMMEKMLQKFKKNDHHDDNESTPEKKTEPKPEKTSIVG